MDLRKSITVSAIGKHHGLIIACMAEAGTGSCTTRKELIVQTFRILGLVLPVGRSGNDELKVKGMGVEDLHICDW